MYFRFTLMYIIMVFNTFVFTLKNKTREQTI